MDTVHGFEPKLRKGHDRSTYTNVPWVTAEEVIHDSRGCGDGWDYEYKRKRKLLLERWGHVPIIESILAGIELKRKMLDTMEELLMCLLTRLDWNKTLASKQDASAIAEIAEG